MNVFNVIKFNIMEMLKSFECNENVQNPDTIFCFELQSLTSHTFQILKEIIILIKA